VDCLLACGCVGLACAVQEGCFSNVGWFWHGGLNEGLVFVLLCIFLYIGRSVPAFLFFARFFARFLIMVLCLLGELSTTTKLFSLSLFWSF